MLQERLILMPCRCQIWKEQNLALKEVTEVDKTDICVVLKIKCLFCHKVKRVKIGVMHYYELFLAHERGT